MSACVWHSGRLCVAKGNMDVSSPFIVLECVSEIASQDMQKTNNANDFG
jgi:hypothetical protein